MPNRAGDGGVDHVIADFDSARMEGGSDVVNCYYIFEDGAQSVGSARSAWTISTAVWGCTIPEGPGERSRC